MPRPPGSKNKKKSANVSEEKAAENLVEDAVNLARSTMEGTNMEGTNSTVMPIQVARKQRSTKKKQLENLLPENAAVEDAVTVPGSSNNTAPLSKKKRSVNQSEEEAAENLLVENAVRMARSTKDGNSIIPALIDAAESRMATEAAGDDDEAGSSQMKICAQIVKGRIVEGTRKGYERTLRFISGICEILCEKSIDEKTGLLQLPVELRTLILFLGEVAKDREDKSIRALSTITGYINAIKHAHTEASLKLSAPVDDYLTKFVNGYGRLVAKKKETGLMKNFEGKVAISFGLFVQLTTKSLFASELRSSASRFVHLFGILCWNMFARSNSVANLRTNHIVWDNDSMVIDMSKHKADQTGENTNPKHIFANPYKPEICPILAMGLHFSPSRIEKMEKIIQRSFLAPLLTMPSQDGCVTPWAI